MGCRPCKGKQIQDGPSETAALPPCPNPRPTENYKPMVVALYNYPAEGPTDCSVRVGERLNVLADEGDFWKVSSTATGRECYIPSNYTAKVYNGWLFEGITREKAEQLLLLPHNQAGSFMVRVSHANPGTQAYSLSVRQNAGSSWDSVKHYRVHRLQNDWVYISTGITFPTLAKLVHHYSRVTGGLCGLLGEPCFIQGSNNVPVVTGPAPTAVRKAPLDWKDVSSSMMFAKEQADNEESLVSEGLREAVSSYLYMTEDPTCEDCGHSWKS